MLDAVTRFLGELTWWQTLWLSLAMFLVSSLGSVTVVAWVLVRLPADYFRNEHHRVFLWADAHPLLRWTALIAKNLLGGLLVVLGAIMSLPGVPGQGLLTILIGIMLLDFPGKRSLERALVSRPAVKRSINRLRERFGTPPLA